MKQNKYDDQAFFNKYCQMERSIGGLESAGEWHVLKTMFPSFAGKNVLDMGCGFGWHCRYAAQQQARSVLGIDISEKMLKQARLQTVEENVRYACMPMEDFDGDGGSFDVVISSLAIHYIQDFDQLCQKIYKCMSDSGEFVFSVEHPIFTANDSQDWIYNEGGEILHWPIDEYQSEGMRATNFLNEEVIKYHRTCASYLNTLIKTGFRIQEISEPIPSQEMLADHAYMKNELRRPMFLMIRAKKVLN